MSIKTRIIGVAATLALSVAAAVAGCKKADNGGKIRIAVIPKGTTDPYWLSVKAGAEQAASELGAEVVWKGTLQESSSEEQVSLVETFIGGDVKGIVLAPLDATALARPVKAAMDQKIPVVIIDSAVDGTPGKDFISFVATDNKAGGKMAGEAMVKVLNGKGNIVLLRYRQGSASTDDRETGFLDVIKQHPDMKMLVDNIYGGTEAGKSQEAAMNMIDKLQQADGVFCPNESSTYGMLRALQDTKLAGNGKLHFVGFDATPRLIDALKKKEIDALVAQNPRKMGYEGVKAMVNTLNGKPVEPKIDSGAAVVTRDNLEAPEIKTVLGGN